MAQHTTTLTQACGLASKAAYRISEALIHEDADPEYAHEHLRAAIQSLTLAESMLRSVTRNREEPISRTPETSESQIRTAEGKHLMRGVAYIEATQIGGTGRLYRFYDGSVNRTYTVPESDVLLLGRMLTEAIDRGDPESDAYLLWRTGIGHYGTTYTP